jgi:hypothetical protein
MRLCAGRPIFRSSTACWLSLALCGCARSPQFNVLGSYFPGWIASMLAGVAVAAGLRMLLHRLGWESRVAALPLFYTAAALLVACACWLIAFE